MKYSELGKLIRSARENHNWDQAHLAKDLRVGQQAVSAWENGKSRPRKKDLHNLIELFSVDAEEWLTIAGYQIEGPDSSLPTLFPIQNLSDEKYEAFCRDLIKAKTKGANVHRLGSRGHKQDGIDIVAIQTNGKKIVYQCKRHQQFGPGKVKKAIDAATYKAAHYYILLSRIASPAARKALDNNNKWSLWDVEDMSAEVRTLENDDKVRLVDTYFPGRRQSLLGISEPSPWQLQQDVYEASKDTSIMLTHGWELVGRKKELKVLKKFEDQEYAGAIIVSGRGAIGKSRLLDAWASQIPELKKTCFLSAAAERISPQSYELLPKAPSFLVIDNADQREDIDAILVNVHRSRPEMKIVLSTRPYGVTKLQDELSKAAIRHDSEQVIILDDLTLAEATELSKAVLTEVNGDIGHAKRIAEITKDCPLATIIGSRLIGKNQIKLKSLSSDKQFRREVMRSFRDILVGKIGDRDNSEICELLDFIAIVQPVSPNHPHLPKVAEKILKRDFDKIIRDIRLLEEAGVLTRRDGLLRIVPDVLADNIRTEACYVENTQQKTGYADKVFEISTNDLRANIITNISRLDWLLTTENLQPLLLEDIWSALKKQFNAAEIDERVEILSMIENVSYYQPKQTLDFVQMLLAERNPTKTDSKALLFKQEHYLPVTAKAAPILRYIAHYLDYLDEALELLRKLAEADERPTNQYPYHPLRILEEIISMEPEKPIRYIEAVANHAISWLHSNYSSRFSAFDVLDELLKTEGYQNQSNGMNMILRAYKVSARTVASLREIVINAAFEVVTTKSLPESLRAVQSIAKALAYPHGILGQEITKSDKDSWEPGILSVLERLTEVVKNTKLDPLVSVEIRVIVSWHANYSETATKLAAQNVLNAIPSTLDYELTRALADSWGRTFERKNAQSGINNKDAIIPWREDIASQLINHHRDNWAELVKLLEEKTTILQGVKTILNPDIGPFLFTLMERSSEFAEHIGRYLVNNPQSSLALAFGVILITIAKKHPHFYTELLYSAMKTESEILHQGVVYAISWPHHNNSILEEEITIARKIATNNNSRLLHPLVGVFRRFSPNQKNIVLEILLSINFTDDEKVADEICEVLTEATSQLKTSDLSEDHLVSLLSQLIQLPSIDEYHIELFLTKLSVSHPKQTLKMLMERIKLYEVHHDKRGYTPIPYSWSHGSPLRFSESAEYENILRTVREWSTENPNSWIRTYYGGQLFKIVSAGFDEVTLKVLSEWINTASEEQLESVAALLTQAYRTFVWTNQQFITKILDHAQRFGNDCYKNVAASLHGIVIQGVRHRIPGEACKEDIEQRDKSNQMMRELPIGSPAYRFYKSLFENANANINQQTISIKPE